MLAVPALHEGVREDAAVSRDIAVQILSPFPRHDGRQARRIERRHLPGVDGEVRDPHHGHLAIGPPLLGGPLDGIGKVLGLGFGENVRGTRGLGLAGAACIDPDHDIALGHPPLRIHRLPVHVLAVIAELLPGFEVPVLEVDVFRVGTQRDDGRVLARILRTEDIGPKDASPAQLHGDVLLDEHRREATGSLQQGNHVLRPHAAPASVLVALLTLFRVRVLLRLLFPNRYTEFVQEPAGLLGALLGHRTVCGGPTPKQQGEDDRKSSHGGRLRHILYSS